MKPRQAAVSCLHGKDGTVNHETKEILYLRAEEDALPFFQALANKNRLEILRILRQKDASIVLHECWQVYIFNMELIANRRP